MNAEDRPTTGPVGEPADPPDIVVVCTANVARSPLLELRLRTEVEHRLGGGTLVLDSTGTEARFGDPAAEGSRRVAVTWGHSLDDHASKPLMYVPLDASSLISTMTRSHVRAITARYPGSTAWCFTVPEFLACLEAVTTHGGLPTSPPPGADRSEQVRHLAEVVGLADRHRPRWRRRNLDVPDPIGASQSVYDALGERFVAAAGAIATALFGPPPD